MWTCPSHQQGQWKDLCFRLCCACCLSPSLSSIFSSTILTHILWAKSFFRLSLIPTHSTGVADGQWPGCLLLQSPRTLVDFQCHASLSIQNLNVFVLSLPQASLTSVLFVNALESANWLISISTCSYQVFGHPWRVAPAGPCCTVYPPSPGPASAGPALFLAVAPTFSYPAPFKFVFFPL